MLHQLAVCLVGWSAMTYQPVAIDFVSALGALARFLPHWTSRAVDQWHVGRSFSLQALRYQTLRYRTLRYQNLSLITQGRLMAALSCKGGSVCVCPTATAAGRYLFSKYLKCFNFC